MGYIGVMTLLLTIDPNFQRDIQVVPQPKFGYSPSTVPTSWDPLNFFLPKMVFLTGILDNLYAIKSRLQIRIMTILDKTKSTDFFLDNSKSWLDNTLS